MSEGTPHEGMEVPPLATGSIIRERYEILRPIGTGSYGYIYAVRDRTVSDEQVEWVLKQIDCRHLPPDEKQEAEVLFLRECSFLASLNHSAIPKLIDSFSHEDCHFIVSEYVHGEDLEKSVKRSGSPFTVEKAITIARDLANILQYLHSQEPQPLIYRDLKPSNVVMTERGRVRLIDFGIARFFSPKKVKDTHIYGTPGFSPPEQYGTGQTDARSDLYALGATLYFLLTLEDPEQFKFKFPPVREFNHNVPGWFEEIIMKCLREKKEERYNGVGEVLDALKHAGGGVVPSPPQPSTPLASQISVPQVADAPLYILIPVAIFIRMFGHIFMYEPAFFKHFAWFMLALLFLKFGISYGISLSSRNTSPGGAGGGIP
jgi:serine/threonine-protein kinase